MPAAMFFLIPKYYSMPEFGQMVPAKSEVEDVYMLTLQRPFKYDNPDIIAHE